jgi:Phage integrase, N-terminal SAM-like domain
MTHLRKMMLEELERRNYAQTTIDCYLQTIEDFARHFHRPPDQLTPGTSASTQRICSARESWLHPP